MEQEQSGEFKFNNCKFKSKEMRTTVIHRCSCQGGNYEDTGYDCSARSLFKVTPEICQFCWAFEKNEEI